LALNLHISEVVSLALSLIGFYVCFSSRNNTNIFSHVKVTHYSIIWIVPFFLGIIFLSALARKEDLSIVIILCSFAYYLLHNKKYTKRASHKKILLNGCLFTIKIWPLLILVGWISTIFLGEFKSQQTVQDLKNRDNSDLLKIIVQACILAPITEEIIFRGAVYPIFKKFFGVFLSCLFSSLIFSLIHFNILSFFVLFVFSCALTYVYEKFNNIYIPIVSHSLFNAIMIVVILLQR
jgi:membrane protease YdiL (CAAX protease family)